jgi:hypothetical protein
LTSAKAIVVVLWAQPLKSADILKQHEVGKIELKRMGVGALFEKAWVRFAKEQSKISSDFNRDVCCVQLHQGSVVAKLTKRYEPAPA